MFVGCLGFSVVGPTPVRDVWLDSNKPTSEDWKNRTRRRCWTSGYQINRLQLNAIEHERHYNLSLLTKSMIAFLFSGVDTDPFEISFLPFHCHSTTLFWEFSAICCLGPLERPNFHSIFPWSNQVDQKWKLQSQDVLWTSIFHDQNSAPRQHFHRRS